MKKDEKDLLKLIEISKSGYAGCLRDGSIVDRREFPNAVPVQQNSIFGIPKPLPAPLKTTSK